MSSHPHRSRLRRFRLRLRRAPDGPGSLRIVPKKLSEELQALRVRFAGSPPTLGAVMGALQGRGFNLMIFLLALPFVTPIPLPGLSTVFGGAIALIALRLVMGEKPWLPPFMLNRALPAGFFDRVLAVSGWVVRKLERLLRPRWLAFVETPLLLRLHAVLLLVSAVALLLPLPIPFTNAPPAWVIIVVAGGLMERDGVALACAYLGAALSVGFFVLLGDWLVSLAQWAQALL
jgi:hypothetical protein